MMIRRVLATAALSVAIGQIAACQKSVLTHKLVVTGNQHSVPLYSDEQTFLDVSHEKQQGGVEGMAGDVRNKFSAREIDDQTAVKVVSSDDNGAVIEIIEGPMKGQSGFGLIVDGKLTVMGPLSCTMTKETAKPLRLFQFAE
jgi:CheY-specific phosphatase CheX